MKKQIEEISALLRDSKDIQLVYMKDNMINPDNGCPYAPEETYDRKIAEDQAHFNTTNSKKFLEEVKETTIKEPRNDPKNLPLDEDEDEDEE